VADLVGGARRVAASIRTRLLLAMVLVLAIGLGATAIGTRQVLLARVDERINDQLAQEAEELRVFAAEGVDPDTGERFGTDAERMLGVFLSREVPVEGEVMITYRDGRPDQRTAQRVPYRVDTDPALTARWAGTTETQRGSVDTPAGPFEYLAVPVRADDGPATVFLVGQFRDLVAAEVDQTVRVTAWAALLSMVAGIAVASALARRILTPIGRVTHAAEEITESDLSRRLDASGHDEVARLAATFNSMLDRLEAAFAQQRQLVDDAGHELRTPITVVRGHLELLDDADPGGRAATRALVLDELDRMHRIVEELLTLAKAEQPDFVRPAPFDLDELTTTVHRKASALSPDHQWQLDEVGLGRVVGDEHRLTQALVALADNAAKHTPPGTPIGIGSAVHGDEVRLWVRDEGPGVAEADAERIFARFARGSVGPRRSDGAGLGLAIVRAIARAHGGEVSVASLPDQGAAFTLRLPAAADRPPPSTDMPHDDADTVDDPHPLTTPEVRR
jgi:two-component system OmpR family sensor kinase